MLISVVFPSPSLPTSNQQEGLKVLNNSYESPEPLRNTNIARDLQTSGPCFEDFGLRFRVQGFGRYTPADIERAPSSPGVTVGSLEKDLPFLLPGEEGKLRK